VAVKPASQSEGFHLTDEYQQLKASLHVHVLQVIDQEHVPVETWSRDLINGFVMRTLTEQIAAKRLAVNRREVEALVEDMVEEIVGLGPIQGLLDDDAVSDILVNGPLNVFAERGGKISREPVRFVDDRHVFRIIQKIIAPIGRRVDERSPMVDARLPDGSRVNVIVPPVSLEGPCLSIRKFRKEPLRAGDLIAFRALSDDMMRMLADAVRGRCNILVSGGTGAGKTTLLNVLSQSIALDERLVTIEDTAELRFDHPHVVRLETRPSNLEGEGEIDARSLVKNALRMRPDRIIIGEIRSTEVLDMLQAMNTGHQGSMSSIHANSARDCLSRVEMLVGFAGFQGGEHTLRRNIASAIDLIVQVERTGSGERRVTAITEVTGLADGQYQSHDLFTYDRDADSFVPGSTQPVGARLREALSVRTSRRPPTFGGRRFA